MERVTIEALEQLSAEELAERYLDILGKAHKASKADIISTILVAQQTEQLLDTSDGGKLSRRAATRDLLEIELLEVLTHLAEPSEEAQMLLEDLKAGTKFSATDLRAYLKQFKAARRPRRYDEDDIRAMRQMREDGESFAKIGERFGCSGVFVRNVCRNKVYKDIR
jgi:hypothetical protein